jgi:hypothetical protein
MSDYGHICLFIMAWLILFSVGCGYLMNGCNKDFQTSCMNYKINTGTVKNVIIKNQTYNKKTTFYLDEIMRYSDSSAPKTCTVSITTSYSSLDQASRAKQNIPLNSTNTIYISKIHTNECYLSDIAEYNFIIGLLLLLICGVPVAVCFLFCTVVSVDSVFRNNTTDCDVESPPMILSVESSSSNTPIIKKSELV